MNNIGYRVKLNDYLDSTNHYKSFLNNYFSLFGIMEVKLNGKLTSFNYSEDYIKYLLDNYKGKVSFHFNKNLLSEDLNNTEKMIISHLEDEPYSVNCISHLKPITMGIDDIERIKDINSLFSRNTLLTLENPEISEDILSYIENVSEVFHKLDEDGINTKLCIDWGHILLNNSDIDLVFNKIIKEDLIKYINEYHIHNIKNGEDHQTICDGDIDCSRIYEHVKEYPDSRIILECEVADIYKDGLQNIKVLTKK